MIKILGKNFCSFCGFSIEHKFKVFPTSFYLKYSMVRKCLLLYEDGALLYMTHDYYVYQTLGLIGLTGSWHKVYHKADKEKRRLVSFNMTSTLQSGQ